MILAGAALSCSAQGILASGQITGTLSGSSYNYLLTIADGGGATNSIGSVWYAWVPGQFYLASVPSNLLAPTGWSAQEVSSGGYNSVRFLASSSSFDIAPGASLSGFGFTSVDTPAALGGNSVDYPATPVGTTVAYNAGFFSTYSDTFVVAVVPEPTSLALLLTGPLCWLAFHRRMRPSGR